MPWSVVFVDGTVRDALFAMPADIRASFRRIVELIMSQNHQVPVEEAFAEWDREPEFRQAYDALEGEFALASALIKARDDANMTQAEVAVAMGTTQAAVARLESGRGMPSTRTLERFAKATGTHLRIRFETKAGAAKR